MTNAAEDFVLKFRSLEGTTVAERRKNLFSLLHQNSSLRGNTEMLNIITSNLVPKTYLESLFKLEFLIYYRRKQEILELLKEGNEVFVSKIARQIWFFKESFNEVGAAELVNEILPCMSFSVRMKVLRKLCRYVDSEQFDNIFDAVAARYGIFIAMNFITGCTPAKIRQVLTEHPIELTGMQLKILYMKDPNLIIFYFENTNNSVHNYNYKRFLKFVYTENQSLYNYLRKKYNFEIIFGRRITKKIVDVEKGAIINKPYDFHFLNMKAVIRKIGKDSVHLFCNALPLDMSDVGSIRSFMIHFPKKYHYSLYVKAVENHYNTKFAAYPVLINEYLLSLIPENLERAVLAKVKVDDGNDDFIKYLTTQESIPLIKEKINVTSDIYQRAKLVKYLIETCHINKDINALTQVMKYFCFRHKNDEINVHMQFIHKIENLFGFEKFTEEMWNYVNDLLTIYMLKFDKDLTTYQKIQTLPLVKFNRGTSTHQKLSYLEFLFKKSEPIDQLILEFLDTILEFPQWGKYNKEFEKYFLLFAININSNKPLDKKQMDYNCSFLIRQTIKWNRCYKDDQISFYDFPSLLNSFNYAIRNFKYLGHDLITQVKNKIFTTTENSHRKEYLEVYWERLDIFHALKDFCWFIKYEPLLLVKYLDKFIKKIVNAKLPYQLKMWHKIKKFSHLQLDDKVIEFCISKLSDDACLENKTVFVPCLAVVMKPENFVTVADSYKPVNKTLDLNNETEVRLYNLQCAIAQHFKHTKSYEVFPSLLNYCAGDYFKYSMRSLYSIMYHTPENMLPHYLSHLAKKAVSVRKHAMYFTCELSTLTKVDAILKLLNKTEEVQSLQKYMFSSTIKYFVKNPSDNFFKMVKMNMLYINKTDDESHKCMIEKIWEVPKKYRALYIVCSWEYLEKIIDIWKKLLPLKGRLLSAMNEEIMLQLPLEFGSKILEEHFLVGDKCMDFYQMSNFAFSFLFCRVEKTTILETVLNIIDQRANRSNVFMFCHHWYKNIMGSSADDLKYFEPFVKYFESKISVIDDFYDYVKIFFLKTKLEVSKHDFVDDLCARIVSFFDSLISLYGLHITEVCSNAFKEGILNFTTDKITVYNLYYYLVKNYPVPTVVMLVLNSIYQSYGESNDMRVFIEILEEIAKMQDPGIQINLRCKFKRFITAETVISSNMETDNP